MVQNRFVVVFARDGDGLVPDAGIDDPLAVELSPKPFSIDARKRVAGAVHPPASVAPTDHRDELASLLVVVSRDEFGKRLMRGSAAEKGHDVLSVATPLVSTSRFSESDVNGAFGTSRADENAVARVALAQSGPLVRLPLPLLHEPPIVWEIARPPERSRGCPSSGAILADWLYDRVVKAFLR